MTNISLNTATEIQIAKALGVSRQSVNRRAISEAWGFETTTVRGGAQKKYPLSSLPSDIRMALLSQIDPMTLAGQSTTSEARLQIAEEVEIKTHTPPYNRQSLWAAWDRATATQKERALKALGLLQMVETLVDAGSAKNRTIKEVGGASGINRATFYRWYKMVKGIDKTDWLPVLLPKSRAAGRRKAKCSPEAWEFFKADYLRQEPTTYTDCYERVKAQGKTRGWQIPSLDTLKRRLFKEFDPTTIALLRGGEEALRKMLPAQCRTVSQMHAMQWINGDGYKHNVFVQWEDGSISRPKTWFWQDVYSRRILAWRTDKTENKNTIRLAFGDVLEIGIPLDVTVDNTRG